MFEVYKHKYVSFPTFRSSKTIIVPTYLAMKMTEIVGRSINNFLKFY